MDEHIEDIESMRCGTAYRGGGNEDGTSGTECECCEVLCDESGWCSFCCCNADVTCAMEGRRCSDDGCNGDETDGAVGASCIGSSMAAIFILSDVERSLC